MKKLKLSLYILFLIFFCCSGEVFSFGPGEEADEWDIRITADEIEYIREDNSILARGNVKIIYGDMMMRAGSISYSQEKGLIKARGDIFFDRDFFTVRSSSMVYNIFTSTGDVYFARVESKEILSAGDISTPSLIIEADSIELRGDDEFYVPYGMITTCDQKNPHYYFSGSNMMVRLEDRFSLRNALFVIRGVPLFYYPYYSKSLGPRKLIWSLDAGSSRVKGAFLKGIISYPLTPNSRTGAGVEIMQKAGPGIIARHSYSTGEGKADFSLYYLGGEESALGYLEAEGRQKAGHALSLRYRAKYLSDSMIIQDYYGLENYGESSLYWLGGAEYSGRGYNLSFYADREDIRENDSYSINSMTLPGFSGILYPLNMGSGLILGASAGYRRNYSPPDKSYDTDMDWASNIRRSFAFRPGRNFSFSFVPGLGYDGRREGGESSHYISFFTDNRFSYRRVLTADSNYRYRASGETPDDPVNNILYYRLTYNPLSPLRVTTRSSYDFINLDRPVSDFFTELEYSPRNWSLYIMNIFNCYEKISRQWLGELRLKDYSRTTLRYESNKPGQVDLDQQFRFTVGPFDLMPAVRFNIENSGAVKDITEKRVDLLWDMHCWESRMRLRRRGGETEFWVLFNISAFPLNRMGMYANLSPDIRDFRYLTE